MGMVRAAITRPPKRIMLDGAAADALLELAREAGFEVVREPAARGTFAAVVVLEPADRSPERWRAARMLLGRRGRVFVALEPGRALSLLPVLSSVGLEPKELVLVQHDAAKPPVDAVIVAACAKPGGLVVRRVVAVAG